MCYLCFRERIHIKLLSRYFFSRSPWCFIFPLLQNKRSLSLYTFLFYMHLFHVPSSFCFFCLARCSFRLFPNFRWDALWGIYSDVTLPYLTLPYLVMSLPQLKGFWHGTLPRLAIEISPLLATKASPRPATEVFLCFATETFPVQQLNSLRLAADLSLFSNQDSSSSKNPSPI